MNNNNKIKNHQLNGHELWRLVLITAALTALSSPPPVVALWAHSFAF